MNDLVSAHRQYLQRAVEHSGLTPSALAKKAHVAQTTVTRLYYMREPVYALNAHSLAAIEKASGLPYNGESLQGLSESEAAPYQAENGDPVAQMVRAATGGLNGIDPWVMRSRALEGCSIVPGDILIVDLNGAPRRGDVVCAQVGDLFNPRKVETAFRLYEPPFLLAQTTVEELREPYMVGRQAEVRGVVIAVVRPRLARAAA